MTQINRFELQEHQLKIQSYYTGKSVKQLTERRYSSSLSGYEQLDFNNYKTISFNSKNNSFGIVQQNQRQNNRLSYFKRQIKLQEQMEHIQYLQRNPLSIFSYSQKEPQSSCISIQKINEPSRFFKNQSNKAQQKKSMTKTAKHRTYKDFLQSKDSIPIKIAKFNQTFNKDKKMHIKKIELSQNKISQAKDFQHFPQHSILISSTKYQSIQPNISSSIINDSIISTYNNQIHSDKQKYFAKEIKQADNLKIQAIDKYQKNKTIDTISRKLFAHISQNQASKGNTGRSYRSQFKTTVQLKKRPSTGVPIKKSKNNQFKMVSYSKPTKSHNIIKTIQFPNKDFEINYNRIKIEAHPIKKLEKQMGNKKQRYLNPQQSAEDQAPCRVSLINSIKKSQVTKKKNSIMKLQEFLPWDSKEQQAHNQLNNEF